MCGIENSRKGAVNFGQQMVECLYFRNTNLMDACDEPSVLKLCRVKIKLLIFESNNYAHSKKQGNFENSVNRFIQIIQSKKAVILITRKLSVNIAQLGL